MESMTVPDFLLAPCANSSGSGPGFGVVMMHGTDDPVVPYQGGQLHLGSRHFDRFLSFDQSLALFRTQNGCADTPEGTELLETVPNDGTSVLKRSWQSCRFAPVLGFSIIGGGHKWPREPQAIRSLLGRVSQEIFPAREIWQFFSAL